MAPFWLIAILTCLAVHRTTRLLTRDHLPLIAVPREKLVVWLDPPVMRDGELIEPSPKRPLGVVGWSVAFLLECDWCMSIWVATGFMFAEHAWLSVTWQVAVLLGLSASTVTGLIAQHEPDA
jgi:hypothetical protein